MLNPTSYQGIVSKNQNEISLHMSIVAKIITATTTTSVDEAGNNQTFRTLSGNNTYLYSYSENWKYLLNLKRRHRNFTSKHKPTRNIYMYVCQIIRMFIVVLLRITPKWKQLSLLTIKCIEILWYRSCSGKLHNNKDE